MSEIESSHANLDQALVDEEHPWPGLASFREQDEHFFKGRNEDIDKLFALVNRERLTVLFGVSGLGKSSLLQAGIFPLLRRENILPIKIRLDFNDVSLSFRQQVHSAIAREVLDNTVEAPCHFENETLWEYFHRKDAQFWDSRNRIVVPLLCFDQFEEVFTLGREEFNRGSDLKNFLCELADLIEGRCPELVKSRMDDNPDESKTYNFSLHPYKVLISLREDYLADLEGLRKSIPSIIFNRMRLTPMNGKQAMAVADQTEGRLMENTVAESVVRLVAGKQSEDGRDLAELRIEPALLSLVCRELNERRLLAGAQTIDAQSVASNREQILQDFIDRSLRRHTSNVRRFIEDKLITVSGYRNSEAYDNAVGIYGIEAEALDDLVQCRVLRVEERDGIKRIELIHDVLTDVLSKSRDQRNILEKQRQAEQERYEAEKREQLARKALQVSKRRGLAFLGLTIIALASSGWGWWSWWDAKAAHKKAQHALAMADFREAKQHYDDNNLTSALAHLAHAIRLDPEWTSSRALLVNLLQQRNWQLPLSIFKHQAAVNMADFSPDGRKAVSASQDNSARLIDAATGRPIGKPMVHEKQIYTVEFSSDGSRVLTASEDNTARLWQADNGEPLNIVMIQQDEIYAARFSPDGKRIVTAAKDGHVQLWDAITGSPVGDVMRHQDAVNTAEFSPDGRFVLTASEDNSARLWDAQSGKPVGKAMMHKGDVYSARFSRDGRRIVTASEDNSARLWEVPTGRQIGDAMLHQSDVYFAAFSPDGRLVATGSEDKTARLWDAGTGKPMGYPFIHEGYVYTVDFTPDARILLTASGDNSARLWEVASGRALGGQMMHLNDVYSAQFNIDGFQIVTASEDKTVRFWDARGRGLSGLPLSHRGRVNSAEFNVEGSRVVTASDDNTAILWDAKSGVRQGTVMLHDRPVNSASFSPDGQRVVTASADKSVKLWEGQTGQYSGISMSADDVVNVAEYSPDGTRIVAASSDNRVMIWDSVNGKALIQPIQHDGPINSVRFSPDGTKLVTASADKTARLWDGFTGSALCNPMVSQGSVSLAEFSPDNALIVASSRARSANLWNSKTCQSVLEPLFHQSSINSARFSPDGTRIVTASVDNTARLWEANSGKPLGEPMQHRDTVNSAEFSPDGTRVVTASVDNTVRMWDAYTGKILGDPIFYDQPVNSAEFNDEGTRVLTTSNDNTARIWDIYPVLKDDEGLLPDLAEAVTGYRLTELSAVEPLEDHLDALTKLRARTENAVLGEPNSASFTRWFLSDPWTRNISPLSKLTVPDFIRQQLAEDRRDQAAALFPGHPLLRSDLPPANENLTTPE